MNPVAPIEVWLFLTAFVAAAVNGALGFGFSSVTVPVALNFLPARTLSPGALPATAADAKTGDDGADVVAAPPGDKLERDPEPSCAPGGPG